jgi:S-adenosylmethionine synthetase
MKGDFLFTSESVTEGHPDKICDQISDAVLDRAIENDKNCRVACETLTKTGVVVVAGEITTTAELNYEEIVRGVIRDIGYTSSEMGFDANTCGVVVMVGKQSPDIKMGVDKKDKKKQGAGDQGLMFGYACRDTEELMPMPIVLAHNIVKRLAEVRKEKIVDFIRPDGKSQVTMRYENWKPKSVEAVVVSCQHSPDVQDKVLKEFIIEEVIKKVIGKDLLSPRVKYFINPTGRFVIGGPQGDCGLTGRKIMVDTYGGFSRHGGGAFSGKDPSKVDRSGAYMARYIAKNIVASGIAERCEVQIAYVIGVAEPVSLYIETFGTSKVPEEKIEKVVRKLFPLRPWEIIEELDLLRPIYRKTAVYGHFGRREKEFTWERTDKAEKIKEMLS